MSLQDDYDDLSANLAGNDSKKLERIWFAFCDLEAMNSVRSLDMSQEDYIKWRDQRLKDIGSA